MGTDCAPLLADLFLHFYEFKFINKVMKDKSTYFLAKMFNNTFRYIDDLMCLNNKHFSEFIDKIYPNELELKETTESQNSASYLDVMFNVQDNQLFYKLYDKRYDFSFDIVNFPYMDSNIPSSPAYGVYMSQLIRYARACCFYDDFNERHRLYI